MAGNVKFKIVDVDKMTSDDVYNMIEQIPSDNESIVSSSSEDENSELFNIEEMQVIFDGANIINLATNNTESDWDSEDEVPLSTLKPRGIIWTKNISNCTKLNNFSEPVGPNIPDTAETPLDVFLQLFPLEFIDHVAFHVNLYALQKHGGDPKAFVQTTADEIKVFLGINLLMGLKKLPSYKDYWSSRAELRDGYISSVMSRDRFSWLLSYLHLNDNERQPARNDNNYDKLYKLRPLLDTLGNTFLKSMNPNENQSIDESMIRFKGRSSIRQYMPMKPIKRGYKVWMRSDSTGYVHQFQIYTGKINNTCEKNLGYRVIKDLTRDIVGKYHKVYFDNYFNSIELLKDLLADKIYACGTARKHRKGIPADLKDDKQMLRGESDWRISTEGICCLKWMDRRAVLFLSNFHNPSDVQSAGRRKKDGSKEEISCLGMVKDYNNHMGYVDKFDMLKSLYECDRKSHKWWHRIFFHFLDVAVTNSYLLFDNRHASKINLKQFRLAVASGLIGASQENVKRGRKSGEKPINRFKTIIPLEIRYDKNAHMPMRSTSLRCAQCSTKEVPHRTLWKCSTCNVGLCINDKRNCFSTFHTK